MTKEDLDLILQVIQDDDSLKPGLASHLSAELNVMYREHRLASDRIARLTDCLRAISGYRSGDHVVTSVADYALSADSALIAEANGRDSGLLGKYARMVTEGFIRLVEEQGT